MKTKILLSLMLSVLFLTAKADGPHNESLSYDIMFKWGLINKNAGNVTLDTKLGNDGTFSSVLVGKSAKWADKFYTVRDTLMGTVVIDGLKPVYYEKISHEGGEFKRDIINYQRSGNTVTGNCDRYKQKKAGQPIVYSQNLLSANGYTVDMLSSFYYMRYLDYTNMKPGDSVTMNIFSGSKKEILHITYQGQQTVSINETTSRNCYAITFSFTSEKNGKVKTSDDLYAWISTDSSRVPVKMQGKLPIGTVQAFLTNYVEQ
ncbi:MAG: DUF3108 domain-containing protein [Muribaculaceae bacterium]|nr:DUF3108 domain-containing protein [Muribaculaceae bacterium]MDE6643653.1 DUF3108 domain-containing protein [Muribaculaceae bacterium]MDE7092531.1 DUF3108 domain-containing protein [Muribaculaceae bacterium]